MKVTMRANIDRSALSRMLLIFKKARLMQRREQLKTRMPNPSALTHANVIDVEKSGPDLVY